MALRSRNIVNGKPRDDRRKNPPAPMCPECGAQMVGNWPSIGTFAGACQKHGQMMMKDGKRQA